VVFASPSVLKKLWWLTRGPIHVTQIDNIRFHPRTDHCTRAERSLRESEGGSGRVGGRDGPFTAVRFRGTRVISAHRGRNLAGWPC